MLIFILLLVSFFLFEGHLSAQGSNTPIKFDGQIRMRSEADGRDFNNDSDVNTYTLLRTRFGAAVQPLEDVNVYIQLQDSRAFGREPSTLANTSNIDVHQAFFSNQQFVEQGDSPKSGTPGNGLWRPTADRCSRLE